GLQDRVSQAFDQPVFMDFTPEAFNRNQGEYGQYEVLPPSAIDFFKGRLFLLFPSEKFQAHFQLLGKSSGKVHSPVRKLWEQGDKLARETMIEIAGLATAGREALVQNDHMRFINLMNKNFELRCRLFGDAVSKRDKALIEIAREFGPDVGAKLPGSGGTVLVFALRGQEFQDYAAHREDVEVVEIALRYPASATL
ncbi:MAG TPA: hypothetical protein VEF04_20945, partial [Blastocatellia bacterium]|nr:hypothetical protein [Blastocatellia bacterium]